MKTVLLASPGEVALADLSAPSPQSMARSEACQGCAQPLTSAESIWGLHLCDRCYDQSRQRRRRPTGGPQSKCQTREEAEAWAKEWDERYTPRPYDDDLYFSPERLYELLEPLPDGSPAPVALLKGSWVLERAEQLSRCTSDEERVRLRMPPRQELPPQAFLSAAQCACCCPWRWPALLRTITPLSEAERAAKPLKVASISHGWLTPDHPDPLGQQLVRFADQVRSERQACPGIWDHACPGECGYVCVRSCVFACGCGIREGCFPWFIPCQGQPCCQTQGAFPSGEFAVFYDWGSLMQKDADGQRTEAERKSFAKAMETMGVWYAHRLLTTFIMSELPEGWPKTEAARPFFPEGWLRGKGWPSFERAVSALIKPATRDSWRRIVDPAVARGLTSGYRAAPLAPRAFAAELALKVFTNGADVEMVAGLYADTVAGAIGNTERLSFAFCELEDEDAEQLAAVLPMAKKATVLNVRGNEIGTRGLDALAAAIRGGAAPKLERVGFDFNPGDKTTLRAACEARGRIEIDT